MTGTRLIAGGAVGAAVAAVGAVVALSAGGAEDPAAASQSTATATIRRQDLVESESVAGTLGYSDARTVINRLSGTVTWTPTVGAVIRTNERLYAVDGEPVYLLDGSFPAYRTLTSGVSGDDVRQFERNMRDLGLDAGHAMTVDGSWDAGTTAAAKRWQARKGLDEDGSIEQGRIVFQPGSRRVSEVKLAAGSSATGGSGGGGGGSNTPAVYGGGSGGSTVFVAATTTTPTATTPTTTTPSATTPTTPEATTTTPAQTTTTPAKPTPKPPAPQEQKQEQEQQRSGAGPSSGGGDTPSADAGADSAVSSELMTTTSTKRIVAVDLETTKQALARRGATVVVELPDGTTVRGTIAGVGKVAEQKASAQNEDPPATIKLVIKLRGATRAGLDQAPVDVRLERRRARDALTVPVTALLARAGGTFAVEVREGGRRRIVAVRTGIYTDSYVEVEGAGLRPGQTITDSGI